MDNNRRPRAGNRFLRRGKDKEKLIKKTATLMIVVFSMDFCKKCGTVLVAKREKDKTILVQCE